MSSNKAISSNFETEISLNLTNYFTFNVSTSIVYIIVTTQHPIMIEYNILI